MTLTQIRNLTKRKAGRNRRSMLEHLLRIEEEVTGAKKYFFEGPKLKEQIKELLQQYKAEHRITTSFAAEAIMQYFHAASEQEQTHKQVRRGVYTSILIEEMEGDSPLVIDLEGRTFDYLLGGLNTPRHITIQNTKGDWIGTEAGSCRGTANIHFKHIDGGCIGAKIGSHNGRAIVTFEYINGDWTGTGIGTYEGIVNAKFQHIKGNHTGREMGFKDGKVTATLENIDGKDTELRVPVHNTVIALNITDIQSHSTPIGTLILTRPGKKPQIQGIYSPFKRLYIQRLIAQNASAQQILNYIEANK